MKAVHQTFQFRSGEKGKGKWVTSMERGGEAAAMNLLAAMVGHYIHKAKYIQRIMEHPNYNGTRTVTVYYNTGSGCPNRSICLVTD